MMKLIYDWQRKETLKLAMSEYGLRKVIKSKFELEILKFQVNVESNLDMPDAKFSIRYLLLRYIERDTKFQNTDIFHKVMLCYNW